MTFELVHHAVHPQQTLGRSIPCIFEMCTAEAFCDLFVLYAFGDSLVNFHMANIP